MGRCNEEFESRALEGWRAGEERLSTVSAGGVVGGVVIVKVLGGG